MCITLQEITLQYALQAVLHGVLLRFRLQELAIVRRRMEYVQQEKTALEKERARLRPHVLSLSRSDLAALKGIDIELKMDRKRLDRLRDALAALEAGQTNAATLPWIQGDNHGASAANPEVRVWLCNGGVHVILLVQMYKLVLHSGRAGMQGSCV